MTPESKEEKKETQVQPIVPNWTFPVLPDRFTKQEHLSSKKPIQHKQTDEKQYE